MITTNTTPLWAFLPLSLDVVMSNSIQYLFSFHSTVEMGTTMLVSDRGLQEGTR